MSEKQYSPEQIRMGTKIAYMKQAYLGDALSAFKMFLGYALNDKENKCYHDDPQLAFTYLQYAADLGFPYALDEIAALYAGKKFRELKKEPDLEMQVTYLKRLVIADKIYDYNQVDEPMREKFYKLQWDAYSKLGRLYITEDKLFAKDPYLGYAISFKLTEERGCTESMYALGRYYRDRDGKYCPSQTLMKKRDVWGTALYFYEFAINNDNSQFSNAAMNEYNHLAQYINERDGRTDENAIQYYRR